MRIILVYRIPKRITINSIPDQILQHLLLMDHLTGPNHRTQPIPRIILRPIDLLIILVLGLFLYYFVGGIESGISVLDVLVVCARTTFLLEGCLFGRVAGGRERGELLDVGVSLGGFLLVLGLLLVAAGGG